MTWRTELLGFPLQLHIGALAFPILALAFGLQRGDVVDGVSLAVIVAGSLVAHELGHALAARGFGLGPVDITLHLWGGATRYQAPSRPSRALLVTLAGPGAGFAIAAHAAALWSLPTGSRLTGLAYTTMTLNAAWSALNLAPVLPLDGGMALRSALELGGVARAAGVALAVGALTSLALALGSLAADQPALTAVAALFALRTARAVWARRPRAVAADRPRR